jgi:hypothetical protein
MKGIDPPFQLAVCLCFTKGLGRDPAKAHRAVKARIQDRADGRVGVARKSS